MAQSAHDHSEHAGRERSLDARRAAEGDVRGAKRRARARLSPQQNLAVDGDARLCSIFDRLDLGVVASPRRSEAADYLEVSVETLDRLFRALVGSAYTSWIEQWRVEAANDAYRRGTAGVRAVDVARALGFGTVRRMTRAFKRQRGETPTGRRPLDRRGDGREARG